MPDKNVSIFKGFHLSHQVALVWTVTYSFNLLFPQTIRDVSSSLTYETYYIIVLSKVIQNDVFSDEAYSILH